MEGSKQLLNACQKLENSFRNVKIGAVSLSQSENANDKWKILIMKKLDDLKLLNSKALLLNATIEKDQMTENIEVSSDITKQQLKDTMDVHSRWNHCIKMIAISRAIYLTFKNNNTEKIKKYKNLLENLGNLDQVLNNLNCSEITKSEELNATTKEWQKITRDWSDKKNLIKENEEKANENNTDEIKSSIDRLIMKMEVMKAIQGRLLASSLQYDWIEDPAKLDKFLIESRKPPMKATDFL